MPRANPKAWRQANKEHAVALNRAWREKNPERVKAIALRRKCKKAGVEPPPLPRLCRCVNCITPPIPAKT